VRLVLQLLEIQPEKVVQEVLMVLFVTAVLMEVVVLERTMVEVQLPALWEP
jgi:hypothetical protein